MIYDTANIGIGEQGGDPSLASQARAALRDWVKRIYGIDLTKVKVTRLGLVKG